MIHIDTTLWDTLSDFVEYVCKGRDESHGYGHMKKVAENALKILESDYVGENQRLYNDSIIVAWLHDINDHKYDSDGQLTKRLQSFIIKDLVFVNRSSTSLLLNIIERISFSRENKQILKGEPHDWDHVIGQYGIKIRHIVSDADKIEALGKIGFERCLIYAEELHMKKFNKHIEHVKLLEDVSRHADEKLLILKDKFMRTAYGKKMSEEAHNEFLGCLEEFKKIK